MNLPFQLSISIQKFLFGTIFFNKTELNELKTEDDCSLMLKNAEIGRMLLIDNRHIWREKYLSAFQEDGGSVWIGARVHGTNENWQTLPLVTWRLPFSPHASSKFVDKTRFTVETNIVTVQVMKLYSAWNEVSTPVPTEILKPKNVSDWKRNCDFDFGNTKHILGC